MSASQGFKQVFMAGVVGAAALGCYLVSLSVASTRAELESVEGKILLAQRDIRTLETEVGTRGRLAQLERWNTRFIRLSAPQADQFVEGAFQLATLAKPEPKSPIDAPVVLASAPAPSVKPVLSGDADVDDTGPPVARPSLAAGDMMHTASLKVEPVRRAPVAVSLPPVAAPKSKAPAVATRSSAGPTATKPAKSASADPLAPLPTGAAKAKATQAKSKE
jgi:hypothetical protein